MASCPKTGPPGVYCDCRNSSMRCLNLFFFFFFLGWGRGVVEGHFVAHSVRITYIAILGDVAASTQVRIPRPEPLLALRVLASSQKKTCLREFSTRIDSNRPTQLPKDARILTL